MFLIRLLLFAICIVFLSLTTSTLVEYFMCQRPEYNPELWNHSSIQTYNNCYIYALNKPKSSRTRKTSPGLGEQGAGESGTRDFGRDYSNYTCDYFDKLIKNDIPEAIRYNVGSINNFSCPTNYYEIALVLDDNHTPHKKGDDDFHFYRKDCGTEYWSHKPGSAPVTKKDASGNLIVDPQHSNRDFPNHNYYKFCGYYCVPNNTNIYDSTKVKLNMD